MSPRHGRTSRAQGSKGGLAARAFPGAKEPRHGRRHPRRQDGKLFSARGDMACARIPRPSKLRRRATQTRPGQVQRGARLPASRARRASVRAIEPARPHRAERHLDREPSHVAGLGITSSFAVEPLEGPRLAPASGPPQRRDSAAARNEGTAFSGTNRPRLRSGGVSQAVDDDRTTSMEAGHDRHNLTRWLGWHVLSVSLAWSGFASGPASRGEVTGHRRRRVHSVVE